MHCLLAGKTWLWWSWQARAPDPVLRVVDDFDRHLSDENPNEKSTKRIYVGKSGPTTAPVGSLTTCQLICALVVLQKQLCYLFCVCRLAKNYRFEKPFIDARDVIMIGRGNFIITWRSVSARRAAHPSTANWFHRLPPGYNLILTVI